jgi:hypothetical protein
LLNNHEANSTVTPILANDLSCALRSSEIDGNYESALVHSTADAWHYHRLAFLDASKHADAKRFDAMVLLEKEQPLTLIRSGEPAL